MSFMKAFQHQFILVWYLLSTAYAQISRTAWTYSSDSYHAGNELAKAFDGNTATFWHTEYQPTSIPFPHQVIIDMHNIYNVVGFSYLPRQDGNNNGNIGQHTISLSLDSTTWGVPVAIGTFLDDSRLKTVNFVARPARYLRIIITTEAGNRGTWTSAAELNIYGVATYSPPPTSLGSWDYTIDFPIVPVAAAYLADTQKVVVWSAYKADDYTGGGGTGITQTAEYDLVTRLVSRRTITNINHDMFCPGISLNFAGSMLVTGGNNAQKASWYNQNTNTWISAPDMKVQRGYQSQTTVSDGRIFTIGGSWSGGLGNKNGETYNPSTNAWSLLPGCPVAPMLTNDAQGVYRSDNHGWLLTWKNGFVFQAGPSKAMNWYDTKGNGATTSAGLRASDPDAMTGNFILYDAPAGLVLSLGGSPNYQNSDATTNAHVIQIGTPGTIATVTKIDSMSFARAFHNSIVLPNGQVFIAGGQSYAVPFSDANSALSPELWDPQTRKFTVLNPNITPRNYHSVAVLLPDSTVLVGGGGLCGGCTTNHFDAEIFSPPFLFDANGARATRPVISSISASSVAVGGQITIVTNSPVSSFSMIRTSTATHSVNTDQRRIPFTAGGGGNSYVITLPADPGIALPGYWMVFAISAASVPSIAKTLLVTP